MSTPSEQMNSQIWTAPGAVTRFVQVCWQLIRKSAVMVMLRIPLLRPIVDRPTMQPLRSSQA